jgi:multidrug efflux pump subunit AcrB
MAALGVTANDINQAIVPGQRDQHRRGHGGRMGARHRRRPHRNADPRNFARLVVRQDADRRCACGDVAEVELAAENNQTRSFTSGRDAVFMSIAPAPDANPLAVSRDVAAILPRIEANLPADVEMIMDWDSSVAIDNALGR